MVTFWFFYTKREAYSKIIHTIIQCTLWADLFPTSLFLVLLQFMLLVWKEQKRWIICWEMGFSTVMSVCDASIHNVYSFWFYYVYVVIAVHTFSPDAPLRQGKLSFYCAHNSRLSFVDLVIAGFHYHFQLFYQRLTGAQLSFWHTEAFQPFWNFS